MTAKTKLLIPLVLLVLAAPAVAGEGLDAVSAAITDRLGVLAGQTVTDPKAVTNVAKADAALSDAQALIGLGDVKSVSKAFKILGKGLTFLEKAAAIEPNPTFDAFVADTVQLFWNVSLPMFFPGASLKATPEEKLGKKMSSPLRFAEQGRFAKAVKKLGSAYKTLVLIDPDP